MWFDKAYAIAAQRIGDPGAYLIFIAAIIAVIGGFAYAVSHAAVVRCKCGSFDVPDDDTMCLRCRKAERFSINASGHVTPFPQTDLDETTSRLYVRGADDEGAYRRKS